MNARLIELQNTPVSDIFDCHRRLIKIVKTVLETETVNPGFQHIPKFVEFEKEVGFNTGEAIAAFARQARQKLTTKQRRQQKLIIQQLMKKVVAEAGNDDLARKCFNVSAILSAILEKLRIWSVFYFGSLHYNANGHGENAAFYYVDDMLYPRDESLARGHSWIFTPVFPVVDLTARHQPLPDFLRENTLFPVLIEDELTNASPNETWYIDQRNSEPEKAKKREILAAQKKYPDWNYCHKPIQQSGAVDLVYIPMNFAFIDKPDEALANRILFGGKTAMEFLNEFKVSLG